MPYKVVEDLSESVRRALPVQAQKIFMGAFNSAWDGVCKEREDREACANMIAWGAVKRGYKKENEKWVKIPMEIYYRGDKFSFEGGNRFKKDLIRTGIFLHPVNRNEKIKVTKKRMDNWVENFHRYQANGGKVFVPLQHSLNPKDNTGWVQDMRREGEVLYGVLEITDDEVAEKIKDGSIQFVSIDIFPDFIDEKGNKYSEIIDHIALTSRPQIRGQGPFVELESGIFENLEEVGMDIWEEKDRPFVFYEEVEEEVKLAIELLKEDWDRAKFSNKPWGDVDKTKLEKEAFLYVGDPERKATWKLPYKDETGKVNIGAVKAIWGALAGARGGVDLPADEREKIKTRVEGWRKELGIGLEQEGDMKTKQELDEAQKEIERLKVKQKELEQRLKTDDKTALEALNQEIKESKEIIEELTKEKVAREKIELEARVSALVKDGKLPPALKDRVTTLLEADWGKPIQLESKDEKVETKEFSHRELLLEILSELPQYVGFEEKTTTQTKLEAEAEDDEKVGKEIVKEEFGEEGKK